MEILMCFAVAKLQRCLEEKAYCPGPVLWGQDEVQQGASTISTKGLEKVAVLGILRAG